MFLAKCSQVFEKFRNVLRSKRFKNASERSETAQNNEKRYETMHNTTETVQNGAKIIQDMAHHKRYGS